MCVCVCVCKPFRVTFSKFQNVVFFSKNSKENQITYEICCQLHRAKNFEFSHIAMKVSRLIGRLVGWLVFCWLIGWLIGFMTCQHHVGSFYAKVNSAIIVSDYIGYKDISSQSF